MALITSLLASCQPKETTFTFIGSTDTHGRFVEFANGAAYLKQMKNELGDRLILLDCGDNVQGTAYQYCSNHDDSHINLTAAFLNSFPYDAIAVGNHDIEAGKKVFDRLYSETTMPVLCANVIDTATGGPYFTPYIILDRDGCKIAILGLLTPYVITWVPERLRPGLRFDQLEEAAQKWVNIIREKEKPDLMIGLFHSGWDFAEQDLPSGTALGRENATKWVAENVPGFDLIFYGHDHRAKAEAIVNCEGDTVFVLNSGSRAQNLAKADVKMAGNKIAGISVALIPSSELPDNDTFSAMVQPYLDRAEAYQQGEVADLPVTIYSNEAFLGPNLWVDEIHRCQFDAVAEAGLKADISIAAPLMNGQTIEAGRLTVKDFFTWYPFENSLAVMSMTGQEVKDFLEYAYTMKDPIYNFDSGAGLLYEVYEKNPQGQRIHVISMADGTPFDLEKTYNVVMNSYRSMGGGKHFMNGLGWDLSDIKDHQVWQNEEDLRSVFIEWARKRGTLDSEPLNQWVIR